MKGVRSPATALLGAGLIVFSLRGPDTPVQARTTIGRTAYVASRPISAGSVIGRGDIRSTEITGEGINGLPGSAVAVVGRRAAVNIAAGRLIEDATLSAVPLPADIEQITVHVDGRQEPGLVAGDMVDVIATDPTTGAPVIVGSEVVVAAVGSGDATGPSVTLDCPQDVAVAIAGVQLASKPLTVVRTAVSR